MRTLIAKILFACLLAPLWGFGQTDSCDVKISLLTATPGEELYSTFGHSALRVQVPTTNTDLVFNYGTFDFNEPGFYTKFIRGKLMYYLSVEDFSSFVYTYEWEGRGITAQVLDLTCAQKEKMLELLRQNSLPQNRYYKYDFLFDNCTTRLRDLIGEADSSVHFPPVLRHPRTFRNLIHYYLEENHKPWSKLGIDILLGARTDAVMTPHEVMFLPDFLMKAVGQATIGERPLQKAKRPLLEAVNNDPGKSNLTGPLFLFTCLFVLIAALSFSKRPAVKSFLDRFDAFLLFLNGFFGCLLIFMWFGTDHIMTKNNYNLLWAWPVNLIFAFLLPKSKKWVFIYLYIFAIFQVLLIGFWFALPQQMNTALIPVLGIWALRSFIQAKRKRYNYETNPLQG